MYKIDKDVPMPKYRSMMGQTLQALKVGDSFVVESKSEMVNARSTAVKAKIRIRVRTQDDGTYRIWRAE